MGLTDLHEKLSRATGNNVNLYFLEKRKNYRTNEIVYKILRSVISQEIGQELLNVAISLINKYLDDEVRYEDYQPEVYYDIPTVEKIDPSEIPYFNILLSELGRIDLQLIDISQAKKVAGYIVSIDVPDINSRIIFIRKYSIKKLLDTSKINMIFHRNEGRFNRIREEVIAIDKRFDAVFLIEEEANQGFIFNKTNFETLFSLYEAYSQIISSKLKILTEKDVIDNLDNFVEICKTDLRKLRKLYRVLSDNNIAEQIKLERIHNVVQDYDLNDVEFSEEGKLVVNKNNIWTVLKLLNDDYTRSDLTGRKYEVHSKKTIG